MALFTDTRLIGSGGGHFFDPRSSQDGSQCGQCALIRIVCDGYICDYVEFGKY